MAWDEAIAASNLCKDILEDQGYEVELKKLEAGLTSTGGLAKGDIDLFLDSWLPHTHEDYWEQHSDKVEKLGIWYTAPRLSIAVPKYVEGVDSLADLAEQGRQFDGQHDRHRAGRRSDQGHPGEGHPRATGWTAS